MKDTATQMNIFFCEDKNANHRRYNATTQTALIEWKVLKYIYSKMLMKEQQDEESLSDFGSPAVRVVVLRSSVSMFQPISDANLLVSSRL